MMEVWGLPLAGRGAARAGHRARGGLINGVLCAYTGISAFIITLATLSVFTGINLGITEAQPVLRGARDA